jgi:hypothetical protein
MWNDPKKLAAMQAAMKEAAAAAPKGPLQPLISALLAEVERRGEKNLQTHTYGRVMKALVPIFVEMREKRMRDDATGLFDLTQGMIEGLGFGIATVLTYVPPKYVDDALRLLFRDANKCGYPIEFDEEPKK